MPRLDAVDEVAEAFLGEVSGLGKEELVGPRCQRRGVPYRECLDSRRRFGKRQRPVEGGNGASRAVDPDDDVFGRDDVRPCWHDDHGRRCMSGTLGAGGAEEQPLKSAAPPAADDEQRSLLGSLQERRGRPTVRGG